MRPRTEGRKPDYPGTINLRPSGRYTATAPANEDGKRKTLGTFNTWEEAEHALANYAAEHNQGREAFRLAATPTPRSGKAIDVWIEDVYLPARRLEVAHGQLQRRSLTALEYLLKLAVHDLGYNGHNDLHGLTTDAIGAWVRTLYTDGSTYHASHGPLSKGTARKAVHALGHCLQMAVDSGDLDRNTARLPKHMMPAIGEDYGDSTDERPEDWPTMSEMRTFLRHTAKCKNKWGSRRHALWVLLAETGMRQGEGVGLSRNDVLDDGLLWVRRSVGVDKGEIFVKSTKSENGTRHIALFDSTRAAIKGYMEDHQWSGKVSMSNSTGSGTEDIDLLFRDDDGGPLSTNALSRAFTKEWAHAGLRRGPSAHGFRHLHASALLEGNPGKGIAPWSIERVAERVGDTVTTVRKVYAHVLDRTARAKVGIEDAALLYAS